MFDFSVLNDQQLLKLKETAGRLGVSWRHMDPSQFADYQPEPTEWEIMHKQTQAHAAYKTRKAAELRRLQASAEAGNIADLINLEKTTDIDAVREAAIEAIRARHPRYKPISKAATIF